MPATTPREQANAALKDSRALIASLRASRRDAAAKVVAERASARTAERPSREQSGAPAEPPALTMERRTREAERMRREATRTRLIAAAETKRLRESRWESKQKSKSPQAAPPGGRLTRAGEAAIARKATVAVAVADKQAYSFPGGFALKAKKPHDSVADKRSTGPVVAARTNVGAAEVRHEPISKPQARPSKDIDAISGLGTALKSKLRRLGLGAIDNLAEQQPDHLRKQLGPVGRLVNIESLIKSAQNLRGPIAPSRTVARAGSRGTQ